MSFKLNIIKFTVVFFLIGCGDTTQTNQIELVTSEPETTEPETTEPETSEPAISEPITINGREHISLTVGIEQKLQFTNDKEVTWSSNNPAVTVDQSGNIFAKEDKFGTDARAIVTATPKDGSVAVTSQITIVNWRANLSSLNLETSPLGVGALITSNDSTIYYSAGPNIFSSEDGMKTSQLARAYPSTNPHIINFIANKL